jgi:DNA (cytosine-5)-methyltransferase 1
MPGNRGGSFTFVDLFAGIGGFHAALSGMGGKCVYASEINRNASETYKRNWGFTASGDLTLDVSSKSINVPEHDVLAAGFPCQPFSKSGLQLGMEEDRGELFWTILSVIERHKPKIVILENVRNLYGPRHRHEWDAIIYSLRSTGYLVSSTPNVVSPHRIPPNLGGRPQFRERIFITATHIGALGNYLSPNIGPPDMTTVFRDWNPKYWNLETHLPVTASDKSDGTQLTESEIYWIDAWDDFLKSLKRNRRGEKLAGFPIWAETWKNLSQDEATSSLPKWKQQIIEKNLTLYRENKKVIDDWSDRWNIFTDKFPPSRRKFEWQAQDLNSVWDAVIQLRPSGIRVKYPNYVPAAVASNQTSIFGPLKRRLSTREVARLQGLPEWFDFSGQSISNTLKQLGNGVSIGAIWQVMRAHAYRDQHLLKMTAPKLLSAILKSPEDPTETLEDLFKRGSTTQ